MGAPFTFFSQQLRLASKVTCSRVTSSCSGAKISRFVPKVSHSFMFPLTPNPGCVSHPAVLALDECLQLMGQADRKVSEGVQELHLKGQVPQGFF